MKHEARKRVQMGLLALLILLMGCSSNESLEHRPNSTSVAVAGRPVSDVTPIEQQAAKPPADVSVSPLSPRGETPAIQVTKTEIPPIQVPNTATPPIQVPKTEIPPIQVPKTEIPPIQVPKTEIPPIQVPKTEIPPIQAPNTATPPIQVPKTEIPPIQAPNTTTPPIQGGAPITEASSGEQPRLLVAAQNTPGGSIADITPRYLGKDSLGLNRITVQVHNRYQAFYDVSIQGYTRTTLYLSPGKTEPGSMYSDQDLTVTMARTGDDGVCYVSLEIDRTLNSIHHLSKAVLGASSPELSVALAELVGGRWEAATRDVTIESATFIVSNFEQLLTEHKDEVLRAASRAGIQLTEHALGVAIAAVNVIQRAIALSDFLTMVCSFPYLNQYEIRIPAG